ncbi:MAG: DUF4743 domain-containing protein [Alphaproteobacteria bacterium]|nr:DUF4743 domain-containing protein [Alphaproteobacteria bacterium]
MRQSIGFLRHVHFCTRHDLGRFVPFYTAGKPVGWVRKDLEAVWQRLDGFVWGASGLTLHPQPDTIETRSEALVRAAKALSDRHRLALHGEIYPVIQNWGDDSLARIDRAAIPWLGIKGCGVHLNGYVRRPDGLSFWVGERSSSCRVDPGKLDLMVGGGLPLGLSIQENLNKEAWEEAGMPVQVACRARRVSTLSYKVEMMCGLRNDTLFIHDLELPESFVPHNTDGEVGAFHLLPAQEVAEIIRTTDRFKFNCNLVMIERLLAHNIITEADDEYESLVQAMAGVTDAFSP